MAGLTLHSTFAIGDESEDTETSLSDLYKSVCERLKVVPISYFIKRIETDTVNIRHRAMIALEAAAIARALKVSFYVCDVLSCPIL